MSRPAKAARVLLGMSIVMVMLLAACGDGGDSDKNPGEARLTGTEWTLASNSVGPSPKYGEGAPTVKFDDGKVEVFTGCNHGTGDATVAGDFVTIGPIEITEMACPGTEGEVEANLLRVLEGRMGFDFDNRWMYLTRSGQLTFEPPRGDDEASGGAEPAPEVIDVSWSLVGATDSLGRSLTPAPDGEPPWFSFDSPEQVSFFTGCNTGGASAEIRGPIDMAEVVLGPIRLTRRDCVDDRSRRLERMMLRTLGKPMFALVRDETLQLDANPATDGDWTLHFQGTPP